MGQQRAANASSHRPERGQHQDTQGGSASKTALAFGGRLSRNKVNKEAASQDQGRQRPDHGWWQGLESWGDPTSKGKAGRLAEMRKGCTGSAHPVEPCDGLCTILALNDGLVVGPVPAFKLVAQLQLDDLQVPVVVIPGVVAVHADHVHIGSLGQSGRACSLNRFVSEKAPRGCRRCPTGRKGARVTR